MIINLLGVPHKNRKRCLEKCLSRSGALLPHLGGICTIFELLAPFLEIMPPFGDLERATHTDLNNREVLS